MTESNKAVQMIALRKLTWSDTNTDAQRARLPAGQQAGPVGTIIPQRELHIVVPTAPINELRVQEPSIQAPRITLAVDHGHHKYGVALYYFGAQANFNIAACNERNAIQSGV